jgi:hypothetical protein
MPPALLVGKIRRFSHYTNQTVSVDLIGMVGEVPVTIRLQKNSRSLGALMEALGASSTGFPVDLTVCCKVISFVTN